jgi:hypothetical protein
VDGGVVLRPVDDVDDERVTLPGLQRRPRVLPVHRDDVVRLAQPLHRRLLDLDDEQQHAQNPRANTAQHSTHRPIRQRKIIVHVRIIHAACRTYNELVVVHFGVCRAEQRQREREAREEEQQQPGRRRRRRRHGESETRRRCWWWSLLAAGGFPLKVSEFAMRGFATGRARNI